MPQSDAYHLNWGTVWALCVAMNLIQVSTVTYFLSCVLSEIVKKWVSLTFVDCSKNFLSSCTNDESELGFVMLIELPGEAVDSIWGYARS